MTELLYLCGNESNSYNYEEIIVFVVFPFSYLLF